MRFRILDESAVTIGDDIVYVHPDKTEVTDIITNADMNNEAEVTVDGEKVTIIKEKGSDGNEYYSIWSHLHGFIAYFKDKETIINVLMDIDGAIKALEEEDKEYARKALPTLWKMYKNDEWTTDIDGELYISDFFSDYYKDVFGHRPRSASQIEREIRELSNELNVELKENKNMKIRFNRKLDEKIEEEKTNFPMKEERTLDDIDADMDDKKERARQRWERRKNDARSDRDYRAKHNIGNRFKDLDSIDAEMDDEKEDAKDRFARRKDDARADRDYWAKKDLHERYEDNDLYQDIVRVLTNYEEKNGDLCEEDMYDVLVNVQRYIDRGDLLFKTELEELDESKENKRAHKSAHINITSPTEPTVENMLKVCRGNYIK